MRSVTHSITRAKNLTREIPRRVALSIKHGIGADIIGKLKDYRRLDRDVLVHLGADQFPAPPLRSVVR